MKQLLYISFCLLSIFSFAQKTYKVTDGEFQFINPGKGIVVKKNNQYFQLAFYSEEKDGEIKHHYNLMNEVDPYVNLFRNDNIYKNQIDKNAHFKDLNKVYFFEETKDEIYTFYQINKSHFVGFTSSKDGNRIQDDRYLAFITVELNDLKFIIFINSCLVIYKFDEKFCVSSNNFIKSEFSVKMGQYNPSLRELTRLSNCLDANNYEEYRIKKSKKGKYIIKTILNETIQKKEYDTIYIKNVFVCKDRKGYDLYNFQFKKINRRKIRGFAIFKNNIQIIQNNQLKLINYEGRKYDSKDFQQEQITFQKPDTHPENDNIEYSKNKYLKLENFHGAFARFELPNGKKGWLDADGKEYLDK